MKLSDIIWGIKSKFVCGSRGVVCVSLGRWPRCLGFEIDDWQIRVMLVWWHVFIEI